MKARVKATGVELEVHLVDKQARYIGSDGVTYWEEDLDFGIEDDNNPDYWTRLEHTYAGMAMQGLITDANNSLCEKLKNNEDVQKANEIVEEHKRIVASICVSYATALIEKLQEEK